MYRTDFLDSMGDGEGWMIWENSIKTCILSSVKQIASPGWMHETSARGWYTGMTQRDGMGRVWEGGSGWGTHVDPWLIHVNVWQKPLQYCKVISLQLIKINGKKKKRSSLKTCLNSKLYPNTISFNVEKEHQILAALFWCHFIPYPLSDEKE